MTIPVRINYRHVAPSAAIDDAIREKSAKLERFGDTITACHVSIGAPHHRHRHGMLFDVKVELVVRGGGIVVSRSPDEDHAHEDVYVALRDSFDAAVRRLDDHVRRRRGEVKRREKAAA